MGRMSSYESESLVAMTKYSYLVTMYNIFLSIDFSDFASLEKMRLLYSFDNKLPCKSSGFPTGFSSIFTGIHEIF